MNAPPATTHAATRAHPGHAGCRAFTFVELVIVTIILTVVAGMVIPRLTSWKSRQGEQSVYAIADMLTAAAKRDTYSTQRCLLEFQGATPSSGDDLATPGRFRMFALRVADVQSFDPGGESWVEDQLAPAAILDGLKLESAASGTAELDTRRFQIEFPGAGGAQGRPELSFLFQDDAKQLWLVRLDPSATRAEVVNAGPASSRRLSVLDMPSPGAHAVDLDAAGRRDDPW